MPEQQNSPVRGIVLAGGRGTRLLPLTQCFSKQLLPIFDKPMVYYPIATLMLAGIREILLISTPEDLPLFERLLGDGTDWGIRMSYCEQAEPNGLAEALILAEDFLQGGPSCLILGDNVFYGQGLGRLLSAIRCETPGATIFGYRVRDPERYGVVEFDSANQAVSIEEKPDEPKSNFAVPGLYFYDGRASALARELTPSPRGELEITDLNLCYLREGSLRVELLSRGVAWLDTGTPASLAQASTFIETIEFRQGLKVCCPEEIAYSHGWIDNAQLLTLAQHYGASTYGDYLRELLSHESAAHPQV